MNVPITGTDPVSLKVEETRQKIQKALKKARTEQNRLLKMHASLLHTTELLHDRPKHRLQAGAAVERGRSGRKVNKKS